MYKQVIVVRNDLKMPKGKLAVQSSHASVQGVLNSDDKIVDEWISEGSKKSVLKVKDKDELLEIKKKAEAAKLKTALITDAGKTFFEGPTITCLAIGPDKEEKIDKITGKLKLV